MKRLILIALALLISACSASETENKILVSIILVGVGILLIFILISKMSTWYDMKRKETLETTARELGLVHGEAAYIDKVCYEAGFRLFSKRGQVTNCISGKYDNTGVAVFNYTYKQVAIDPDPWHDGGTPFEKCKNTAVLFSSEASLLPDFAMLPTTEFHGWGTFLLDSRSIDPKLVDSFEKNYDIRGTDENQISRLFTIAVLDFFSRHRGFFVQAIGNQLIVYIDSEADFKWLFDHAITIYELFRKG